MNKKNYLLILWIIFGFVFVLAVDSLVYLIIYIIFHIKLVFGLRHEIMLFSMPIITLLLYGLTTFFILKKIRLKSGIDGIYLTNFPKRAFIVLALIAIFIKPIISKLAGLFAEDFTYLGGTMGEYLAIYGWLHASIAFSKWLVLISVVIIYLKYLNLQDKKTKHNNVYN